MVSFRALYIFLFSFLSLFSFTYALAIVPRSTTPSYNTVGPVTNLTVSNWSIAPDGFLRSTTLAGGTFPGPLIRANKGEKFAIDIVNELRDPEMWLSTSVHWHGIFQNGTNYVDGTAFITQCPISQNHSFLAEFEAKNQAGTYWYHSHYASQMCDGLRGPLVIYDPDDPYRYLYDVDDETTVITLADWYHIASTVLDYFIGVNPASTLINGLGRYAGGPQTELAVVNVEYGKRYRFRVVAMSCEPSFLFSIDGHNLTVIEADGDLTEPLLVDSLTIYAGQRYSVVFNATQPVGNYWMRALPSTFGSNFNNGLNTAILRYNGAPIQDPTTTNQSNTVLPLLEQNLHALFSPGAPGVPGYGQADMNILINVTSYDGLFYMNGVRYRPPTVPTLLQILSGAQQATNLLPNGSVIVLEPNQVVEVTVEINGVAGPHPIHLHGHAIDVVQSAGSTTFNYKNPVRRDVTSAGLAGQRAVFRFVTDNAGPWFLHCHVDWHINDGFAVVMAENPTGVQKHLHKVPESWRQLCPIFDSLSPSQLGALNAEQQAANITSLLLPS